MRHSQDVARRGLTLIELLAASILALLLVGSVLGILNSVTRRQAVLLNPADRASRLPWESRLASQFYWDLLNSRRLWAKPGAIILEGFGGRDFETQLPLHCPATICYELVTHGDRKDLHRREIHPDSRSLENSVSELVCIGVDGISLETDNLSSWIEKKTMPVKSSVKSNGPDGEIPDRLVLSLYSKQNPKPTFQHVFTLR